MPWYNAALNWASWNTHNKSNAKLRLKGWFKEKKTQRNVKQLKRAAWEKTLNDYKLKKLAVNFVFTMRHYVALALASDLLFGLASLNWVFPISVYEPDVIIAFGIDFFVYKTTDWTRLVNKRCQRFIVGNLITSDSDSLWNSKWVTVRFQWSCFTRFLSYSLPRFTPF